ncbi:MAG: hypothetical protein HZA47_02990 [Planctomycetes bacterium]|uniref:hypothetical protein n=1 Tax=Candidatus Wunengus sp. YC65 TaxID=3367701 RepID=UPI001E1A7287|nr:hypothetical protein [Planctomycetota bacterium]
MRLKEYVRSKFLFPTIIASGTLIAGLFAISNSQLFACGGCGSGEPSIISEATIQEIKAELKLNDEQVTKLKAVLSKTEKTGGSCCGEMMKQGCSATEAAKEKTDTKKEHASEK